MESVGVDSPHTTTDAGSARVQQIRAAALVRSNIGVTISYAYVDGRHKITLYDRTAGELRTWSDNTLEAAVAAAKEGR